MPFRTTNRKRAVCENATTISRQFEFFKSLTWSRSHSNCNCTVHEYRNRVTHWRQYGRIKRWSVSKDRNSQRAARLSVPRNESAMLVTSRRANVCREFPVPKCSFGFEYGEFRHIKRAIVSCFFRAAVRRFATSVRRPTIVISESGES